MPWATLMMAIAGEAGSLAFMIWAGRRNPSWLLIGMFIVWVSTPFAALACSAIAARRWPKTLQATLCAVAFLVTACSLLIYGYDALGHVVRTRAFVFLVVPPASMAVGAVLLLMSSLRFRGKTR